MSLEKASPAKPTCQTQRPLEESDHHNIPRALQAYPSLNGHHRTYRRERKIDFLRHTDSMIPILQFEPPSIFGHGATLQALLAQQWRFDSVKFTKKRRVSPHNAWYEVRKSLVVGKEVFSSGYCAWTVPVLLVGSVS